jgi:uncharacterized protein involved in exopolysaccharide biosynthesis
MAMDNVAPSQNQQETGLSLLELVLIVAEHLRLVIAVPLGTALLALGVAFLIPPTYTATARILPPSQPQSISAALAAQLGSLAALVGGSAGIKNPADQYVALLKSRTVRDAIIDRFNLKVLYDVRYREDARKQLDKNTNIYAGVRDGIISIEVDDRDAKRAADVANAFVEELRILTNALAITEAGQRRVFFQEQVSKAKTNLVTSEMALRGSAVNEATLRTVPQSALESLARLKAQITAQEIKLASLRAFMTNTNPEFRLATQELDALRAALAQAEKGYSLTASSNGAEYIAKYRDFKYHETLFELMAKQYELARLDEAREGAVIQVVDAAQAPERKSRPKRALIAVLAGLGALFITVLFVVVRQSVRTIAASPRTSAKFNELRRKFVRRS